MFRIIITIDENDTSVKPLTPRHAARIISDICAEHIKRFENAGAMRVHIATQDGTVAEELDLYP